MLTVNRTSLVVARSQHAARDEGLRADTRGYLRDSSSDSLPHRTAPSTLLRRRRVAGLAAQDDASARGGRRRRESIDVGLRYGSYPRTSSRNETQGLPEGPPQGSPRGRPSPAGRARPHAVVHRRRRAHEVE